MIRTSGNLTIHLFFLALPTNRSCIMMISNLLSIRWDFPQVFNYEHSGKTKKKIVGVCLTVIYDLASDNWACYCKWRSTMGFSTQASCLMAKPYKIPLLMWYFIFITFRLLFIFSCLSAKFLTFVFNVDIQGVLLQ